MAAQVECWAIPPIGAEAGRRYPSLLNIHGGPYTQYGNRFFDEFQIQAGCRFRSGVLQSSRQLRLQRGLGPSHPLAGGESRSGIGLGWRRLRRRHGVRRRGRSAASRGSTRPASACMGGSYGGYLTSWIVGHTDGFRAACSERSCNNLLSLEQSSDIATAFRTYVGKSHLEAPDIYLRHSPMTFVEQITTPLLILHSEQDLRCPISQAEELFVALRLLGPATGDGPLPGGEPRAVPLRLTQASGDARRTDPRLVQATPGLSRLPARGATGSELPRPPSETRSAFGGPSRRGPQPTDSVCGTTATVALGRS